jgi:hypothetical protein
MAVRDFCPSGRALRGNGRGLPCPDLDQDGEPLGGVAANGFALVWTARAAFVYDPNPGTWTTQNLGTPVGVSADGGGSIAIFWADTVAYAYSGSSDLWYSYTFPGIIDFGDGEDEAALVWGGNRVVSFNTVSNAWNMVILPPSLEKRAVTPEKAGGAFRVEPNPTTGSLSLSLPGDQEWAIEIVRLDGSIARRLTSPATPSGSLLTWDGKDGEGNRVPAGVYWVRGQSGQHVEARRIVIVH